MTHRGARRPGSASRRSLCADGGGASAGLDDFPLGRRPARVGRALAALGSDGAQAARALLNNIRRLGDVFFAWLGRGRCSFALS